MTILFVLCVILITLATVRLINRRYAWFLPVTIVPLLAAIAQIAGDGFTALLIPLYLLALLLPCAVLLAYRLLPAFRLPSPGGEFAIGTQIHNWHDDSRNRSLTVQYWYPAEVSSSEPFAPYMDDPGALARQFGLPAAFIGHLSHLPTQSRLNASPAKHAKFSVIIFSHGATGTRTQNTAHFQELASRGFFVVSIDHDFSFDKYDIDPQLASAATIESWDEFTLQWEERVLPEQSADQRFVLDMLENLNTSAESAFYSLLDTDHAGIFGHSAGGATALETCRLDSRFVACLSLDGHVYSAVQRDGISQPLLVLSQDTPAGVEGFSAEMFSRTFAEIDAAFAASTGERQRYVLRGSGHATFTDLPLMFGARPGMVKMLVGTLSADHAIPVVTAMTASFFEQHLSTKSSADVETVAAQFPELEQVKREKTVTEAALP